LHRNGVRMLAPFTFQIENDTRYLVNPGSVGQPRDHDPQAGYVLFTPDQRLVEFGRVSYDIEKTQRKIIEAGLPDLLASRLSVGK
jgi:diadenosine tetraphosphatase ApaH/serine/threonine PP2A family protein phosphatase